MIKSELVYPFPVPLKLVVNCALTQFNTNEALGPTKQTLNSQQRKLNTYTGQITEDLNGKKLATQLTMKTKR